MQKTWMPTVSGILSIISGGLSLLFSVFTVLGLGLFLTADYWDSFGNFGGPNESAFNAILIFFVLPYIIISLVAIIGGVFSIRRRLWGLALAGAICAFFSIWGWALGIGAIVLVSLSKNEFDVHSGVLPPQGNQPPSSLPPPAN